MICPANPYHVIRPILEISGMRELLRKRGAPVIAVTPIVGGKALRGSAGKMMRDLGKEPSPRSVDDRVALARAVLDFAASVREIRALEVE